MSETDEDIPQALRLLWRVGFTRFAGYLAGGIGAWRETGRPLAHVRQLTVEELTEADVQPLDVRKDEEWQNGRIPGARNAFLGELREKLDSLERDRPYATYCQSGFRASIGASILHRAGIRSVANVPGSFGAWKARGFAIET